jgi:hypothetical protein
MLPPIYTLLTVSSSVTALVGSNPARIYRHGEAPQGVALPYITWSVVSGVPQNALNGTPAVDACNVDINCWSKSDAQIVTLGQAVRDALETSSHMSSFDTSKDYETKHYRMHMQFDFWLLR